MRIAAGVILIWPGTHASIPSLWVRETALDGRYPKAITSGTPGATGGSPSHTHTSPPHTHSLNDHTHTFDLSQVNTNVSAVAANGLQIPNNHIHEGVTVSVSGGTTQGTAVTYGAVSNDPPFREVIYIRATAGAILADGIVALWAGDTVPNNWQYCNGDNGSPDYRGRYLKGAPTNSNAGGAGGSTTNVHDISHTHATTPHSHIANSGPALFPATRAAFTSGISNSVTSGPVNVAFNHTHTGIVTSSDHAPIAPFNGSITCIETVEPSFRTLGAIQKKAGGLRELGIIGLWLGAIADIPKGWQLFTTIDVHQRHLKIGSTLADVGVGGGSNTHSHALVYHSHGGAGGHSHGASGIGHVSQVNGDGGGPYTSTRIGSGGVLTHSMTNVQWVNPSYGITGTTGELANNEPEFTTVALVQLVKNIRRGGSLAAFM